MTIPATRPFSIDPPSPIPPTRRDRRKYPYDKLKVGESFLVTDEETAANAINCARVWASTYRNGWRFARRRVEDGHRIWRTA